jgi:SAM-dependent methyltransferase
VTVVGVDPWAPALELAHGNVAAAGLEPRIRLVQTAIEDFDDPDPFDLAWLPCFFIADAALDAALARTHALLRPGGIVVVGIAFADETEPLERATDDLLTLRSGGSLLQVGDAVARLERAGFERARGRTDVAPTAAPRRRRAGLARRLSIPAQGSPNQVVSASTSPAWVRSPTQAT